MQVSRQNLVVTGRPFIHGGIESLSSHRLLHHRLVQSVLQHPVEVVAVERVESQEHAFSSVNGSWRAETGGGGVGEVGGDRGRVVVSL